MYSNPQRRDKETTQELRRMAGAWLRDLRKDAGLSQRQLAAAVNTEYYTFVSQLENGHGRLPPDKYIDWAAALNVEPREFVKRLMSYYDPVTYDIIFGAEPAVDTSEPTPQSKPVKLRIAK